MKQELWIVYGPAGDVLAACTNSWVAESMSQHWNGRVENVLVPRAAVQQVMETRKQAAK